MKVEARSRPKAGKETLISYRGGANDGSIDCLLELAERKLQHQDVTNSTRKRLYRILVETLQNTYLHLDKEYSSKDGFPIKFSLKKEDMTYTVNAGNHVKKSKVRDLQDVLDRYNAMSLKELKAYYLYKLSKGQLSQSGGAGLGLVDILRKSGEKISYSFKPVNKDYSYFSLQVKVSV
jgi:hypothetical protein